VYEKFLGAGAPLLSVGVGLTPTNLPMEVMCYHAKFGGYAAMLARIKLPIEKFAPLDPKFNYF